MYALIRNVDNKVSAVRETKNELIRLAVSTENVRRVVRGDYTLHSMTISEAWEKIVSKDYKIESVGF